MSDMIPVSGNEISQVIQSIVIPVMEPLCKLVQQNTEALERITATLNLQGKQIEALEKQVRMNTPVSSVQARHLNSSIRDKAKEVLDRYGRNDKKSIDAVSRSIRKDILIRAGIANVRELPRCEYDVAIRQVQMWNNAVVIREIMRKAAEVC